MESSSGTIGIVQPPSATAGGNRVTALRWARIFRRLGWQVFRVESWKQRPCDVLVALHARKSHTSILRFRRAHPGKPIVVAATGTDIYTDIEDSGEVREALGMASRIVVLQPMAFDALDQDLRARARVIRQSLPAPAERMQPRDDTFEVCVLANFRPVKDPLLAARAARLLPPESRVRIVHLGAATDPALGEEARQETAENERYTWLGERPRREALEILGRARLLLSTSRHEGGANSVSEAIVMGVPVLSTKIPGGLGLLGEDYPGVFPVGDAEALAALLERAETDPAFYAELEAMCGDLAPLFAPEKELESWKRVLDELKATVTTKEDA